MARIWLFAAGWAALSLGSSTSGAPPAEPLPAWMAGNWVERRGDRWTEERWSHPRAGVMLGTNLSGRGDRATGFEFIRIAAAPDGTVTYWGSPGGKPAVPFRRVSGLANEAVFENPKHDFPTRIAYRRDGPVMIATVSGPGGADRQSWTFRLSR